jgi:hypothetical protein
VKVFTPHLYPERLMLAARSRASNLLRKIDALRAQ